MMIYDTALSPFSFFSSLYFLFVCFCFKWISGLTRDLTILSVCFKDTVSYKFHYSRCPVRFTSNQSIITECSWLTQILFPMCLAHPTQKAYGLLCIVLLWLSNKSLRILVTHLNIFVRVRSRATWASYQIRKIAGCACAGNAGNVFPPPLVSDPDMHHGTFVTHVPWCMPGSLTNCFYWSRWPGKRSRHSRRMHNPQFYVSGKRPIESILPQYHRCFNVVSGTLHSISHRRDPYPF